MAKKKSVFRGKVSSDVQTQKTKASQYGYLNLPKGVSVFIPPTEGKIFVDIMPYEVSEPKHPDRNDETGVAQVGDLWYKRPYKVHRNVGPNNDSYVCPTSIGMPCPICEFRAARKLEGADDEELRALKPSRRNLYCIIPINDKKHDEKPHIWDISQFLFQDKLNDELGEQPDFEVFPDLEEGYTLRIRFSEQVIGKNKFGEVSRIDFEERDAVYAEGILSEIPDLDKVLNILTYAQLKTAFLDLEDAEAGEEDAVEDDDAPAPVRRKKETSTSHSLREDKKFKKIRGEEAEEEEEVEEEEVKPRRSVKRKVKEEVEEEEVEEEEEAEEEVEEEKPRKKSSRKKEPETMCPYGHKFGKDCDKFPDDCDACEEWDACMDEKTGK